MERTKMKTFTGTVRDGVVRLPRRARVQDGSRVVLAVLSEEPAELDEQQMAELEKEDVEFMRACRGRLAKCLRDEDA